MKKSRSQSSGRGTSSRSSSSSSKSSGSRSNGTTGSSKSASASSRSSSGGRSSGTSGSKSGTGTKSNSRASSTGRAATSRASSKSASSRGRKEISSREGLQDVLKDGLKDIYYAEKQMVKSLKKVTRSVSNQELKECFETHREQTEQQIELLEQAFEALEMRASGKKCPAMDGLVEETNEHLEKMDKGPALDAALIVGAQKAEHYEIAAYGSLRAFAKSLGLSECEQIFDQILQQESEADELLTQVAQTVNQEALQGDEMRMAELEEEQM